MIRMLKWCWVSYPEFSINRVLILERHVAQLQALVATLREDLSGAERCAEQATAKAAAYDRLLERASKLEADNLNLRFRLSQAEAGI